MSFTDELKEIKKAETGAKYISTPGVQILKVTGYTLSDTVKDYSGKPYIEIHFANKDGEITNNKFYRAQKGDSETARDFKNKQLKEFFTNAGADFKLEGEEFLKSVKGNKLKVLLREEEYLGKDKTNNDKPEIKSIVRYAWSSGENEEIGGNKSHLHKKLDEKQMAQYKARLEAWEEEFGSSVEMPDSSSEMPSNDDDDSVDDLPF